MTDKNIKKDFILENLNKSVMNLESRMFKIAEGQIKTAQKEINELFESSLKDISERSNWNATTKVSEILYLLGQQPEAEVKTYQIKFNKEFVDEIIDSLQKGLEAQGSEIDYFDSEENDNSVRINMIIEKALMDRKQGISKTIHKIKNILAVANF